MTRDSVQIVGAARIQQRSPESSSSLSIRSNKLARVKGQPKEKGDVSPLLRVSEDSHKHFFPLKDPTMMEKGR